MADYFVIVGPDGMALATVIGSVKVTTINALAMDMARLFEEPMRVLSVRVNIYHEPVTLGENLSKLGTTSSARRLDQSWEVTP